MSALKGIIYLRRNEDVRNLNGSNSSRWKTIRRGQFAQDLTKMSTAGDRKLPEKAREGEPKAQRGGDLEDERIRNMTAILTNWIHFRMSDLTSDYGFIG